MTFIISEIGSNWLTQTHALNSIALAKNCGASAVKFQAFDYEALYGSKTMTMTSPPMLPLDWLPKLKEKADACGIEFMCTAFSPELVAAVDPFVSRHKVASSDLNYPALLRAVAATGKPLIVSTGGSSKGDVWQALAVLGDVAAQRTTLLYCNAAYPSRRHNLFLIDEMRATFGRPVGLSDHSLDVIYAPLAAVRHHGATVVEKHFTAYPDMLTPDRAHSLSADEFKIMCDYIAGTRDGGGFNPTSEEDAMIKRHNRRLVATQPITRNDVLVYGENFGAYRSLVDDLHGYSPMILEDAAATPNGKRAMRSLAPGDSIGPGDFA